MKEILATLIITFCNQNFKKPEINNYCKDSLPTCIATESQNDSTKLKSAIVFCTENILSMKNTRTPQTYKQCIQDRDNLMYVNSGLIAELATCRAQN